MNGQTMSYQEQRHGNFHRGVKTPRSEDQITVWDTWREMTILPADNKMSETAQLKNLSIIKDKTYDRGLNV